MTPSPFSNREWVCTTSTPGSGDARQKGKISQVSRESRSSTRFGQVDVLVILSLSFLYHIVTHLFYTAKHIFNKTTTFFYFVTDSFRDFLLSEREPQRIRRLISSLKISTLFICYRLIFHYPSRAYCL